MYSLRRLIFVCIALVAIPICARELSVAVGWHKPPYVEQESDSGFELELVREVFELLGNEIHFIYVPYGRSYTLVDQGLVDASLTLSTEVETQKVFLSDVYIEYQNVAISLPTSNAQIERVQDLQQYSIVAFQNAHRVLSEEFTQVSKLSPHYIEVPDQTRQVEMLLQGNFQIAVMDVNIFLHISQTLLEQMTADKFAFHPVFRTSPYRIGFKDRLLRDRFNVALAKFKSSSDYQNLFARYPIYRFDPIKDQHIK